jgi:hypothetical protein
MVTSGDLGSTLRHGNSVLPEVHYFQMRLFSILQENIRWPKMELSVLSQDIGVGKPCPVTKFHDWLVVTYWFRTTRFSNPGSNKTFLSSPKRPHLLCGPLSFLLNWYRKIFVGVNLSLCEINHSVPSSAEIKNKWSYNPTRPYMYSWRVYKEIFNFSVSQAAVCIAVSVCSYLAYILSQLLRIKQRTKMLMMFIGVLTRAFSWQ